MIILFPLAIFVAGVMISAPAYKGPPSDHFDGTRFRNLAGVKAKGGRELIKWMLGRKRPSWTHVLDAPYGKRPLGHFKDGIRITFVNHSTFLIQVDGINILTDPVWSRRVSPFSSIGPSRKRPPGIRFEDLPRIHVVLISHNHYDHLDMPTMRMLLGAHHPRIVVPLGVKKFLDDNFISGSLELDWWQDTETEGVGIRSVPAQHFSGRGLLDRDKTLWSGYVMTTSAGKIYFAGDTGYHERMFSDIRSRCGTIKIALLPIGAYKPEWFMSPIHVSPAQAVKIHGDVNAETSIATHFGTFALADDGPDDPVNDLRDAMEKTGVGEENFIVMKEGEPRVVE